MTRRVPGEYIPVADREANEWLSVECFCGEVVIFPWAGYEQVACPRCQGHNSTAEAVAAPTPGAAMQVQAMAAEARSKMLALAVNGKDNRAEYMRKLAEKWRPIENLGNSIERCLLGRPHLYGNVKSYWKGRVLLAPSSGFIIVPLVLILGPFLMALPMHVGGGGNVHPLFYAQGILAALGIAALFASHCTEPGILEKQPAREPQPSKYELINGTQVEIKWCKTCHLYRRPRASHCARCDVCVDQFDHHCHITGTCVGRRNVRPFLLFVIFTLAADVTAWVCAIDYLFYHSADARAVDGPERFALGVVLMWTTLGGMGLFLMLTNLMGIFSAGLTTRERLKDVYNTAGSNGYGHPFDTGSIVGNLRAIVCAEKGASQVAGKVDPARDGSDIV
eukprot:Rhum_TRINITY_DN3177_c0_g1::Rhum_TRINITY_DN3177_c0_g1_i1::g.9875::m.9875/K16675/ZDHHC9_14_18; palmitoyltransferase ZDHHC9/14/18